MPEQAKPNVAGSLFTIHAVITRALNVTIENVETFRQQGFPDSTTQQGFADYVRSLVSVLHSHHLVEDDLAFPYLQEKLPEAPYDLLIAQHQEMLLILDQIDLGIDTTGDEASLNDLKVALEKVDAMWHPHIQIEEEHFTIEKTEELIDVEEHLRLIKQFGEYSQQHSGPNYLVIPFILYNLPVELRNIMARAMPPEVTQNLVPIVWKEKWESMKAFLLD